MYREMMNHIEVIVEEMDKLNATDLSERYRQVLPPLSAARHRQVLPPSPLRDTATFLPAARYRQVEREIFIGNLLVRIHFIIGMIRWTGPASWEFEF